MAQSIRKMTCLTATVEDRPGALAEVLQALSGQGVNLVGLWAYPVDGGKAEVMGIPDNANHVKSLAAAAGIAVRESSVFVVTGENRVGALVEATRKIAAAGVNLRSTSALSAGDEFAAAVWVDPEDVDRVAGLLGV